MLKIFKSGLFIHRSHAVCVRFITGGLFVGLPEQIPRSSMLTEADLQYYVSQYKERGFRLQIFQLPVDCVSVCAANK